MMTQNIDQNKKNTPSNGSLYRETSNLRQLATKEGPPSRAMPEEGDELMANISSYLKLLGALSVLSLLAGFLAAAFTQ